MKIGMKIKLINDSLKKAMDAQGFKTVADLYRACGINQARLGQYLNLKAVPRNADAVKRLTEALRLPYEDIFPEDLCAEITSKGKELQTDFYLTREVERLPLEAVRKELTYDGHASMFAEEDNRNLKNYLDCLTPRERFVISGRYGIDGEEKPLSVIADELHVGRERVRQIEMKAIRKLRHPTRVRVLKGQPSPFYDVQNAEYETFPAMKYTRHLLDGKAYIIKNRYDRHIKCCICKKIAKAEEMSVLIKRNEEPRFFCRKGGCVKKIMYKKRGLIPIKREGE